jgi:tRNA G18 (ribose-2'-O)-methylase SpoU
MWCERIDSLNDPRVAEYRNVPDPELLRAHGVFIAEGRQVVRSLLTDSSFGVRSVLVSEAALEGLRDVLERRDDFPVYLATSDELAAIVGFNLHRGCLAIGQRPSMRSHREVLGAASRWRLLIIGESIGNADNMGGIFRNAASFGAGAVLLSPGCCDPLYRKAIRVSVGASLRIPFGTIAHWPDGLADVKAAGYTIVALTPDAACPDLTEACGREAWPGRIALVVGHEGGGLTEEALAASDLRVRLAMQPGVDSVNVSTAAGIALYVCARRWGGIVQE